MWPAESSIQLQPCMFTVLVHPVCQAASSIQNLSHMDCLPRTMVRAGAVQLHARRVRSLACVSLDYLIISSFMTFMVLYATLITRYWAIRVGVWPSSRSCFHSFNLPSWFIADKAEPLAEDM